MRAAVLGWVGAAALGVGIGAVIGGTGLAQAAPAEAPQPAPAAAVANRPPSIVKVTVGKPNSVTGAVSGRVRARDPNWNRLAYQAATSGRATATVSKVGVFTYAPTATTRHAAARTGAPASETTDLVTVTVSDNRGGSTSTSVAVPISPANNVPTLTARVGAPDPSTGVVTGTVAGLDADGDPLSYSSPPTTAKGSVSLSSTTGAFTYTPTSTARSNAGRLGATGDDKSDSFTVTVTDGYGGTATQTVGVAVAPMATTLTWAGQTWSIKSSRGAVGPGPNVFDPANAWVDTSGYLHLRIDRNPAGTWTSAEIVGPSSLGYGTYTFTLGSDVSSLDANAVLGLFTWSDSPSYAHRELDIEFSRWGVAADPTNAQYVVQPFDAAGHLRRFTTPATAVSSHAVTWTAGAVNWASRDGTGAPIASYAYSGGDVPVPGDERVRLNLWLYEGAAPDGRAPVEVVVRSFAFTPA